MTDDDLDTAKLRPHALTRPLTGRRCLVVEHDMDARDILEQVLTSAGARVTCASHADEALARLAADPVHVLLASLALPDKDGLTLVRELRARAAPAAHTPAIALSGRSRPEDLERSLAAGYQAHLTKPFTLSDLVREIVRLVPDAPPTTPAP